MLLTESFMLLSLMFSTMDCVESNETYASKIQFEVSIISPTNYVLAVVLHTNLHFPSSLFSRDVVTNGCTISCRRLEVQFNVLAMSNVNLYSGQIHAQAL